MLTNHDHFWVCCLALTDEARFDIYAKVRRVIDSDPFFIHDSEQAAFILDRVFEIALILTEFKPTSFSHVREYLHLKLRIVRCDRNMFDYTCFRDLVAFDESIDRLKLINRDIQYVSRLNMKKKI